MYVWNDWLMGQLRIFSAAGPEVTVEEQRRVTVVQTFRRDVWE